jgi:hypothetical protein
MEARYRWVMVFAVVIVLALLARGFFRQPEFIAIEPPECPDHDSLRVHGLGGKVALIDEVRLAGDETFIPEFHDCQRLMKPDKVHGFGALAAVWASDHLAMLVDSLQVLNPPGLWVYSTGDSGWRTCLNCGPELPSAATIRPADPARVRALPFAIIHAWNHGYPPLHIERGWNCLYLFQALSGAGFESRMVQVRDHRLCFDPQYVASLGGVALPVTRMPTPAGLVAADVPPVARWDTDFDRKIHYIGLKCGDAWCEVTDSRHYHPSAVYTAGATGAPPSTTPIPTGDRVITVKGWYDEQLLAVRSGAGSLIPATFRGIAVPDSGLDTAVFRPGKWRRGGWAAIETASDEYRAKFNLARGKLPPSGRPEGGTEIWICMGNACPIPAGKDPGCAGNQGEEPWFFQMINLATQDTAYRCVTRRSHANQVPHVFGTARWAWVPGDEKLWFRCGDACCTNN